MPYIVTMQMQDINDTTLPHPVLKGTRTHHPRAVASTSPIEDNSDPQAPPTPAGQASLLSHVMGKSRLDILGPGILKCQTPSLASGAIKKSLTKALRVRTCWCSELGEPEGGGKGSPVEGPLS